MLHNIEPSSFYGSNRASLDLVRSIRLSRLSSAPLELELLAKNEKKIRNRSSSENSMRQKKPKMLKLFPGVKHGIKKPNKNFQKKLKERLGLAAKRKCIREAMKDKFDFSRTPYAIHTRKPRIALNEEHSLKRKFFKTSVQVEKPKKNDPAITAPEFEETNDIEEERFAEISQGVSKIINHIDWSDDEDYMKPQLTKKKADEIINKTHNLSYITTMLIPESVVMETKNALVDKNNATVTEAVTNSIVPSVADKENVKTPEKSRNAEVPVTPKFYPIFTSPGSGNILSDVTNRPKKSTNNLLKAASPNDQYQIDAGQKIIGPTECKKCGMVYDIGDPVDESRHKKFHKSENEMQLKSSKTDNIVGYSGTDRIILIQHSDSKYKLEKVKTVLKLTENDIGSGYSFERYWKAFLYIRQERILGCLIAEPIVKAHRAIQSGGIILLSEESHSIKCGINRIWVRPEFRGQKIATTMINCLRKNFIYGEYLKIDDVAFSVTTADGNEFAKKYTNREDYLTYSIS